MVVQTGFCIYKVEEMEMDAVFHEPSSQENQKQFDFHVKIKQDVCSSLSYRDIELPFINVHKLISCRDTMQLLLEDDLTRKTQHTHTHTHT